jgi:hypothetical protein
MLFIHRKWFADWRDSTGHRFRKGFKTKGAAKRFQEKMRAEVGSRKKHQASRRSPNSPRHGQRRRARVTTPRSPRGSTRKKLATAASSS